MEKKAKYGFYTAKEITPDGWLEKQLRVQADGLCGNLDLMWPDIRDSAWIGGNREGWERVPYWLDGFIPMAYLLRDEELISRGRKYIDAILENQKPDGWICPCADDVRADYDIWALFLIMKTLVVYYDCSGDERVPDAVYRAMKNCYELFAVGDFRLNTWGKYRWFEAFVSLIWLKRRYSDSWIDELARALMDQGADYNEFIPLWKRPLNLWRMETHIVNIAMMLKSEALIDEFFGDEYKGTPERLEKVLREYNGTPVGLFTGDECLSGLSPIQGTELCAVVEQMYSYERLYAYTGDAAWAEKLELLAFNALPAETDDLMNAHQYLQMSNQIDCRPFPGKSVFRTNGSEAHVFGLEPNYGCCTANFGQGWPKLALSCMFSSADGVECAVSLPLTLKTTYNGVPVEINVETEYPFRTDFHYTVTVGEDTDMIFRVRVPSFARQVRIDAGNGVKAMETSEKELVFRGFKKGSTGIGVSYGVDAVLIDRPYGLKTLRRGPLVYSLPVKAKITAREYEKNGIVRAAPFCDYDYARDSDWNYAFASDNGFTADCGGFDGVPFSSVHPPVSVSADMVKIDWGYEDGYENVCAREPEHREPVSAAERIKLIPYGCAKLRMTEMPCLCAVKEH